jgi:signal transduction histidine kinase
LSATYYFVEARSVHDALQPILLLPEGQASYGAQLRRIATAIALFDLPLLAIVAIASYVLARISVQPLAVARAREERFAADAAHELRTPLATIATVAQAARAADPQTQERALETIAARALDASTMVSDLMLLMRQDDAERRLHEPVDLAVVARTTVRDAIDRGGPIAVECRVPDDGAYVIGEERALRRLVGNLIENALRHARTTVTVTVEGGAQIVLSVDDDGPGVADDDRERIFERFYKARSDGPGSGLGLAICRRIAAGHGGTLGLEGPARFVARLPQAPA